MNQVASVAAVSNSRMASSLLVFFRDFDGFLRSSILTYSYLFTNLLFYIILLRVYLDGVGFSEIYLFKLKEKNAKTLRILSWVI